jgi:type VI secretion system protein ImpC
LLEKISQVAAAANAPFVAASSPELFGWDTFTELAEVRDLAKIFDRTEYAKWRSFRDSEDSRYVGLTLPHTLMRLPYGKETVSDRDVQLRRETSTAATTRSICGETPPIPSAPA